MASFLAALHINHTQKIAQLIYQKRPVVIIKNGALAYRIEL